MHPHFPELIAAFKEEPDAYDSFIAIVRSVFFMQYSLIICAYTHITLHFSVGPRHGRG